MNLSIINNHDPLKVERNVGQSLSMAMDMFNTDVKAMAEHLGMSRAYLYKIKEQKSVNADRLEGIAEFYHLTPEQFLDLPLKPVTTAYISVTKGILDHLRKEKPDLGRFTKAIEEHGQEIIKLITTVERG